MTPLDRERWQRLSSHLDELLEIGDPTAREAWLASLGERDSVLAHELQSLMTDHRELRSEGFLELMPFAPRPLEALAGQVVGSYRLVSLIGHGGMGSVWLAERSDGRFERQTAIKFLSVALVGRGEGRFRGEGRILARLTHPHIGSLIDAGVTDGGQPYLVLEHVDGEHIDRWCDRVGLDVEGRVRLFLEILDAVAYAHAHLIVHRDLKPSNVLVTREGHVKLLDFGIAKLLEGDTAATAELAFTPEYAAPEQMTGEAVTTATDVYALGVLLYVLLTGRHPVAVPRQSVSEMAKAIVETAPTKASDVLGADLDTIIAKALKKRPAERYLSVTEFADDLRRYLRHEPIRARPDTLAYRMMKFSRRYRMQLAGAALIVAVLSGALYEVNRERAIAQRRFLLVRGLSSRLFDVDIAVRQLSGSSKARQVLVDAALEYLQRIAPEAQGDQGLALELGTAYMRVARVQGVNISPNLGQVPKALESERIAAELIDSVLAAEPNNRTAILRAAQIKHDQMILTGLDGDQEEALRFAHQSAPLLDRYLATGEVDPRLNESEQFVIVSMNVANRFRMHEEFDPSIDLIRRTIDVAKLTNQPAQAAAAMTVAALTYRQKGDLEKGLQAAHDAVVGLTPAPQETSFGRQMTYALALIREAQVLGDADDVSLGRSDEAIPLLERAYAIAEGFAAADAGETTSRLRISTVGRVLAGIRSERDPAAALRVYDAILRRTTEIRDNSNLRREEVRSLAGASYALRRLGRAADARRRVAEAFERLAALKEYPSPKIELGSHVDEALRARAADEADRGDLDVALATYGELQDHIMATSPHVETSISAAFAMSRLYGSLAGLNRRAGKLDAAASLDRRRSELWQRWNGRLPGNPFVARQIAALDAQ